ncbi:MAG: DODA-type extradiol aromatic ring-opening family dioxygenase, partial [Rhodospirillales bacterium]
PLGLPGRDGVKPILFDPSTHPFRPIIETAGMDAFPFLFVSHGTPLTLIRDTPARRWLQAYGQQSPKPKAILIMSAHWLSDGPIQVTGWSEHELLYDFYNFPDSFYEQRYPAPGDPDLAGRIVQGLKNNGYEAELCLDRGLDHGSWVPLLFMFPQADIPVIQISLPYFMDDEELMALGNSLSYLADEGVLVLGSGLFTHSRKLRNRDDINAPLHPFAKEFMDWMTPVLESGVRDRLASAFGEAPRAIDMHPTDEHFRPLMLVAGRGGPGRLQHRSLEYGAHVMDMWSFGGA